MVIRKIECLAITALAGGLLVGVTTAWMQPSEPLVAFVGVNVLPMVEERVLSDQTVLVRGDRISEIGPRNEVSVPDGALEIEGEGSFLMPGFGEMHGHIPSPERVSRVELEEVLFLYVANGVTTVRGMQGAPGQLELQEEVDQGELLAPTLYLAGPAFSGNTVDTAEQAAERVSEQKREGWDLLKILPGLTRDQYDSMAKRAGEVGIRFAGHVPSDVGIVHALEGGQATVDHLDGYIEYLEGGEGPLNEERLTRMVERTRRSGAGVVPTMALWETIIGAAELETMSDYPELKYRSPREVERWRESYRRRISQPGYSSARASRIAENRKALLRALSEGGVRILFGTDAPQQFSVPGFSIHREIPLMVESGMSPYEILVSATRNVGEHFREKDRFGVLGEGQRADLILLERNPLQDALRVKDRIGVMVRGKWISEEEIQKRLEEIEKRQARAGA